MLDATKKSDSVTVSPLTDPSLVVSWFNNDVEPRNTKGNVHAAITITNLGPVKKFLSD